MPGKFLEYIRAGRYVVPVELSFLPATYTEVLLGREVTTTKWVEPRHWKEIKTMLKPAVELVAKYNEAGSEKISKSHHLSLGQDISFGYIIHLNKDKSPFLAVLDCKRNVWTDAEDDDETDENTDLADYGGRHKSFTPTKCYIKACVIKKSGSVAEDGKKLRKELGVKSSDVRNYFTAPNTVSDPAVETNPSGISCIPHHEKNKSRNSGKKKEKSRREGHHHHRRRAREGRGDLSSTESLIDLPPPISHSWGINDGRNVGDHQSNSHATIIRSRLGDDVISGSSIGPPGFRSFADEDDDDSDDSSSVVQGVVDYGRDPPNEESFRSKFFRNWDEEEEEDDESLPELPDIEETNHVIAPKGRRGKRAGGSPRKKFAGDRSPIKHHNVDTGLPDIDDGNLGRGTRVTKGRKKRSVAIVEPMKPIRASSNGHVSFEEAIGAYGSPTTDRRKKGRNMSSPTVERLSSANRSKNSAIEILSEDSELLPFADSRQQGPGEKRKKKDGGEKAPRKRRKKKPAETSIYDRLTPSPFPESPDEDEHNEDTQNESDSEPEMPVLVKMVNTSDEEQDKERNLEDRPTTVPPLERVVATETISVVEINPQEQIVQERIEAQLQQPTSANTSHSQSEPLTAIIIQQNGGSSSPHDCDQNDGSPKRKKKKLKRRSKTKASVKEHLNENDTISQISSEKSDVIDQSGISRRARYASDSDDITAESAYRKTPLRKKKRRKITSIPEPTKYIPKNPTNLESMPPKIGQVSSERRITGDAQTQTILSGSTEPFSQNEPIENVISKPTTKTERPDDNHSYDSDYVNGTFSDGDDDDVLFEGQFQANLHLPSLGSPEEGRDDLELFSFENPATVTDQSASINNGVIAPSIPSVDPRPEETVIENDEINYSFDLSVPPASNTVTIDGSYCGSSKVVMSFQHNSEEQDENEAQIANFSTPGNMSIFQLINHPGTLKAGVGLFNQLKSKKINADEVQKRLSLKDACKPTDTSFDRKLMPPPPSKRPISPDICSLNPEKRLRRVKPKKLRNNDSGIGSTNGRTSPLPGPSGTMIHSQSNPGTSSVEVEDSGDEDSGGENVPDGSDADSLFRELMVRTQECEAAAALYEPQGDEFDLSQRSHCMLGVVPQYAEKSRRYKMHAKKIKNITIRELKEHFEIIKPEIQGIFDGTVVCFRSSLYCSKNHHDKALLRSINVNFPFEDEQGKALSTYLFNLLLPQPGSRLKYTDYINYVMLPESFIRIYSKVNSVCYEMAEKEMRCGGCYDDTIEN